MKYNFLKKILLTDLDDTLLCSDKSISDGNRAAIEEMIAAGHYFAICTGRSLTGGMKVAKQLGLNREGCYLICYQGNVIYDLYREEVLFEHFMDTKEALELMGKLSAAHIYSHTYRNGRLLVPGMTKELTSYLAISGDEYHAFSDLAELQEEHLYKVISIDYDKPQRLQDFCDTNQEYLDARFNYFFSSPYFMEFISKDSGKGVGALQLAKLLGVDRGDLVACGDERNDISMIEAAGIGVCMANGHPEVQAVADYVTKLDNNHDGISEVIHKFILN